MTKPFYPPGCWPLQMTADLAAAFCGEPSVEAFRRKVDQGLYPRPLNVRGSRLMWHQYKLAAVINERHGLLAGQETSEDVASYFGSNGNREDYSELF